MGGGVIFMGNEFEPQAPEPLPELTIDDYAAAAEGTARIYMWGTPDKEGVFQVCAPAEVPALDITAAHRGLMAGWDNQEVEFQREMNPKEAAAVADYMAAEMGVIATGHGLHLAQETQPLEAAELLEDVMNEVGKIAADANAGYVPNNDVDGGKAFLESFVSPSNNSLSASEFDQAWRQSREK